MSEPVKHHVICPLCEATCGLEIEVDGEAIGRIAGDRNDVFSRGFVCPKGAAIGQLHNDPDRLRAPLVREASGGFREVTWDEAFAHIAQHLLPTRGDDPNAAAVYLGNPNVHSLAGMLLPRLVVRALGTRNIFSASTVDQMPKHVTCGLMYGDPYAIPVPDVDRSDYLLLLGANPWESNGSLWTAPDLPGRLKALRERGGRFVVVDPRRTRSAEHASEHIPIRPGTDAFLLLGLIHVLVRDGRVRVGRLAEHLSGLDEVTDVARPFTPVAVSRITGVPSDVVERLARELSEHERAAVYGRIGTHTVAFGTLAAWAVEVLNALTGHLDAPGGAMWAQPAHLPRPRGDKPKRPFELGRWKSRARGYPEAVGEFPSATLADEIETEGPGQVRVLITVAGNPVLSVPNSGRLDRLLADIPFMVSVDPYLNETTRHAHVILPPPSPLTRNHFDLALSRLAVRNHARWSKRVFEPSGPSEAEILARLALIAFGQTEAQDPQVVFDLVEQQLIGSTLRANPELAERAPADIAAVLEAREPLDRCVEIMVRGGAYGDRFGCDPNGLTYARLLAEPHGIDFGPLQPGLPELLQTPSGKVELMPEPIRADLARLTAALEAPPESAAFRLIGRRELRSNNSWMHNLPLLVKGKPRCTLLIHPDDAARLGVSEGQSVRVQSRTGELCAPAQLTDTIMQGVVSLPHGYGHDRPGTTQRTAMAHAGVNFNLLTDAIDLDPLSGNAVLNGIDVALAPA